MSNICYTPENVVVFDDGNTSESTFNMIKEHSGKQKVVTSHFHRISLLCLQVTL